MQEVVLTKIKMLLIGKWLNESGYLENGYFTIESRSGICYMIKISSDTDEPLVPTQAEVKNNFYLI